MHKMAFARVTNTGRARPLGREGALRRSGSL